MGCPTPTTLEAQRPRGGPLSVAETGTHHPWSGSDGSRPSSRSDWSPQANLLSVDVKRMIDLADANGTLSERPFVTSYSLARPWWRRLVTSPS